MSNTSRVSQLSNDLDGPRLLAERLRAHGRPVRTRAQLTPYMGWDRLFGVAKPLNKHSANEPPMSRPVVLCAETAEYLYSKYTPTTVRYRRGSRPVLEGLLSECVLRGRPRPSRDEDLMRAVWNWTFYHVCRRYLVTWDLWHARQFRYHGPEEDTASLRNRSDCYCSSRLSAAILEVAGIPTRLIFMQSIEDGGGHTVFEAWLDGRWCFVDQNCHNLAYDRQGRLASYWQIMNDPYCRNEGVVADPAKPVPIRRLAYLANATLVNAPIAESTRHYRKPHGSVWFEDPDGPEACRVCRFGF